MTDTSSLPQNRITVPERVDEKSFFSMGDGKATLVDHSDLEEIVPNKEKEYLEELERYWVNKPYAFVVIYQNKNDQELRYYCVEPTLNETEQDLLNFLKSKLKRSIDFDSVTTNATASQRADVVREGALDLIERYNLIPEDSYDDGDESLSITQGLKNWVVDTLQKYAEAQSEHEDIVDPVPVERDSETGERKDLEEDQVNKLIYYLTRDFIRYDKIDAIKHDINIEDISCNGYNSRVFVYHTEYEHIVTNVQFGREGLDDFVIKIAQKAGKGISIRQPSVDATLADGSRAKLQLGTEITGKGTNFTIRQFNDVPFTPIDLIVWGTFSMEQMAYLWLAIENGKSMVIAGGTASGKTTTLNAGSLFIPSKSRTVSIEDTREIIIPQKNWVANKTRESFQGDSGSEIDMFKLVKDALRHRPDYIIMGEVRGEEGTSLFQAMNSGHTVYTTFHANDLKEVIRRFTQEPINVSKQMFGSVDLIVNQQTRQIGGRKMRRAITITEVDEYTSKTDQFKIDDAFLWDSETDTFRSNTSSSRIIEDIKSEREWNDREFEKEHQQRMAIFAYLIKNNINSYAGVAATIQAYMNSPEIVMSLISNHELKDRIDNLRTMQTVEIDVDPEKEELVPRPTPGPELTSKAEKILKESVEMLEQYESVQFDMADALRQYSEEFDADEMLANQVAEEYIEGDADGERSDTEQTDETQRLDDVDAEDIDEEAVEAIVDDVTSALDTSDSQNENGQDRAGSGGESVDEQSTSNGSESSEPDADTGRDEATNEESEIEFSLSVGDESAESEESEN